MLPTHQVLARERRLLVLNSRNEPQRVAARELHSYFHLLASESPPFIYWYTQVQVTEPIRPTSAA
jgi:hypothetical protein